MELSTSAVLEAQTVEGQRRRARSLAAVFAAGGGVSALVLVSATLLDIPAWAGVDRVGIALTVVAASGSAVFLAVRAERVGSATCHLLTASGSVLIAVCQTLAGGGVATASYALLYVLVVLHASMFFTRRVVAAQLAFSVLVQGTALLLAGEATLLAPQLILTAGTQSVAALVVASLAVTLRFRADTDPLTGLGNRRRAHARLVRELERSRQVRDRSTCLAVLGVDDLTTSGAERGHAAGDVLLADLAGFWRSLVRDADVLARTGDGQFMLVLADCEPEVAAVVVRRLLDHPLTGVSCSAGLAVWNGAESAGQLMLRADHALHLAKEGGPVVVAGAAGDAATADDAGADDAGHAAEDAGAPAHA